MSSGTAVSIPLSRVFLAWHLAQSNCRFPARSALPYSIIRCAQLCALGTHPQDTMWSNCRPRVASHRLQAPPISRYNSSRRSRAHRFACPRQRLTP